MTRDDLTAVPDGGTLRELEGGLQVIRRRKHEPIAWSGLTAEQWRIRTGRVHGSKFNDQWPLTRLADWIEAEVRGAGWRRLPGESRQLVRTFSTPVGYSDGRPVYNIKIVNPDGMYVHAYPVGIDA